VGRPARELLGYRPGYDLTFRRGVRAVEQWPSPGFRAGRCPRGRLPALCGTCPAALAGSADITALYTARYGAPPVGKKVDAQVNQFVDGWGSLPASFWAIVLATT
jgi:hypothetical protein